MSGIRTFFHRKNIRGFLIRLFLSYCFILAIILLLGLYLYNIGIRAANRNFWEQNRSSLGYLKGAESDFYYSVYQAKEALSAFLSTQINLPILSYYIYLRDIDYILSPTSCGESGFFFDNILGNDLYYFEDWRNAHFMTDSRAPSLFSGIYRIGGTPQYLYRIDLSRYPINKIPATACFLLDFSALQDYFNALPLFEGGRVLVSDADGNLLFSVSGPESSAPELQPETQAITVTSDYNRWSYRLELPKSTASRALAQSRNVYIASIIIACALGLAILFALFRRSVTSYVSMDRQIQSLTADFFLARNTLKNQEPLIQSYYTRHLLTGTFIGAQELAYLRGYLRFADSDRFYYVLYFIYYDNEYINLPSSEPAYTVPHSETTQRFFETISAYLTGTHYLSPVSEGSTAVLCSCENNSDTTFFAVQRLVLSIHETLLAQHNIWTYAGFGGFVNDLANVWESYSHAVEASKYSTKNYIFLPYDAISRKSVSYYYPPELSVRLSSAVLNGSEEQVRDVFRRIQKENFDQANLSGTLIDLLLSDIRSTLYKVRCQLSADCETGTVDPLFQEIPSLARCEKIALGMARQCSRKTGTETQLIDSIKKYLEENYADASLGFSKISELFHISESYFSHLFKSRGGVNFSTYLESLRMNTCLQLMKEGSCRNINSLYEQVGYNNAASFRRVFKKTYGVSPSEMIRLLCMSSEH